MSELFTFTAEQREAFRRDCAAKGAHAAHLKQLREARAARGGAMTNAERQRAFVARANDIREIPEPADAAEAERCRFDFVHFVHRYGAVLLKEHMPSPLMIERILKPLQESVLNGGQVIVEMPRGKGKTSLIDLLAGWAVTFGHRKFVVLISATSKLAKTNLQNVMKLFTSPAYAADFPHIALPFLELNGKWQLCDGQTYRGERTGIEMKGDHVTFPTLRDDDGNVIGDAAGAILFSGGVGSAVRGLNEGGLRPDLIVCDDIQKRKDAKSPKLSADLEEFVNQDVMGLFGHGAQRTALMALTPICDGDFAALMTDGERNPAWITIKIPLVIEWPSNAELVDRFFAAYREDCARDDFARTLSKQFYVENREALNAGCVLLDPLDGAAGEVDALHHVLLIRAAIGKEAFDAEYQMLVREEGATLVITPDVVKHALNGVPRLTLPPGTDTVVGFCDVNARADSGLRYGLLALGAGRVTGFIDLSKYPAGKQPLFAPDLPQVKRPEVISQAVRFVGLMIAQLPVRFANGKRAPISAFAFDGGNWTSAVARAVLILRQVDKVPYMVFWTLGRGWAKFGNISKPNVLRRGDHMFETKSRNGKHIVFHSDYWKEITQSLFLSEPLSPGSASLWGSDPFVHDEFAQEVCAERLVRKFVRPDGRMEWDFVQKSKRNHFLDVAVGSYVVASWIRAFDCDERVIDRAAVAAGLPSQTAPRVKHVEGHRIKHEDDEPAVPVAPVARPVKKKLRFRMKLKR